MLLKTARNMFDRILTIVTRLVIFCKHLEVQLFGTETRNHNKGI